MITSQETSNILKAMITVAPEIQSISKSKQAYGYKYATLDSLIDMLRGVLPKHGLWFVQMPTRIGEKSTLTTRVIHSSGEWIEDAIEMTDTELQGKTNDTQRLGASITYFRRYALSAIFGVAADEDVDGNINTKMSQTSQEPKPKAQAKTTAHKQTETPPTQKQDPVKYLRDDYGMRAANGETVESILKDYADILKTDNVRPIEQMDEKEITYLARAIYKRDHNMA